MIHNLLLNINKDQIFYEVIEQSKLLKKDYIKYFKIDEPYKISVALIKEISYLHPNKILLPGGILKPSSSDYFIVNEDMYEDVKNDSYGKSDYNYLSAVAYHIAEKLQIQAIAVKPLSLDSLKSLNRINGIKNIVKSSRYHACQQHSACLYVERVIDKRYDDMNVIVAYIGDKTSVGAHQNGKCVDVNDAYGSEGPMGFTSSGDVPILPFVEKIISEKLDLNDIEKLLFKQSGLSQYHLKNAADVDEFYDRDEEIKIAIDALAYQVSKYIGSAAISLNGHIDVIVVCGEGAKSKRIVELIKNRVESLGQVIVFCDFDIMRYLEYISEIVGTKLYPVSKY